MCVHLFCCRWLKVSEQGKEAEMSYCRKCCLKRSTLIDIQVCFVITNEKLKRNYFQGPWRNWRIWYKCVVFIAECFPRSSEVSSIYWIRRAWQAWCFRELCSKLQEHFHSEVRVDGRIVSSRCQGKRNVLLFQSLEFSGKEPRFTSSNLFFRWHLRQKWTPQQTKPDLCVRHTHVNFMSLSTQGLSIVIWRPMAGCCTTKRYDTLIINFPQFARGYWCSIVIVQSELSSHKTGFFFIAIISFYLRARLRRTSFHCTVARMTLLQCFAWVPMMQTFSFINKKVKQNNIYIKDTTLVSGFPLLLFGGSISVQHREQVITLDDWIQFKVGESSDSYLGANLENSQCKPKRKKTEMILSFRRELALLWFSRNLGIYWTTCWEKSSESRRRVSKVK